VNKKVSIIIPCFNSEVLLPGTTIELESLLKELIESGYLPELVFIDDGSKDNTMKLLLEFKNKFQQFVRIVQLTGNFGSYNAFLAGCNYATGDCCIQLHDDLQDPPVYIPEMLRHWENGYKMVIGQRVERQEPFLHQLLAKLYHGLMRWYALPHVPPGGYDLILFDKELRDHVVHMNEANMNLVYLLSWLQYPYVAIPVKRSMIKAPSRWNFIKRTKLVIDSFVGFSYSPIRLINIFAWISIAVFIVCVLLYLLKPGFEFLFLFFSFFFMLTLIGISVVAEYVYRTLYAARKRPPFIVYKEFL
jgi:dolichol-phosphate mannosyltransferase